MVETWEATISISRTLIHAYCKQKKIWVLYKHDYCIAGVPTEPLPQKTSGKSAPNLTLDSICKIKNQTEYIYFEGVELFKSRSLQYNCSCIHLAEKLLAGHMSALLIKTMKNMHWNRLSLAEMNTTSKTRYRYHIPPMQPNLRTVRFTFRLLVEASQLNISRTIPLLHVTISITTKFSAACATLL